MSTPRPVRSATADAASPQWAHLGPAVSQDGPDQDGSDQDVEHGRAPAPSGSERGGKPWAERPADDADGRSGSSAATAPGAHRSDRSDRSDDSVDRVGVLGAVTRVLVALAVPLTLVVVGVRLVATPLFLWLEYHRPGFPEDPYGFGVQDRMTLGSHGMDYILNWAPGEFLSEVRTSSGRPWFTPDEVSHMTDVKWVMQVGLWAGVVVIALALVLALLRRRDRDGLLTAVAVGGWLTVIVTALLAVVAAVAWQQFFAAFHSLFFSDGTWTFSSSDTLIRLYPTQFWIDAAAVIALITVGGSVLAALLAQRARSSRSRSSRSGAARRSSSHEPGSRGRRRA